MAARHSAARIRAPRAGGEATQGAAVCILDSQQALAEALAAALLVEEEIGSAMGTSSPASATAAVDAGSVDVLVVGMDSDEWDALDFIYATTHRAPDLVVVAISGTNDPGEVKAAILAGAGTWVPKQMHLEKLVNVVVRSAQGEAYVPPAVLRRVLNLFAQAAPAPRQTSVFTGLTEREKEVLQFAAQGLTRAETAEELGLSLNTVRTHIQHILSKLRAHSMLEAVTRVLREQPDA
jgi:DNA-binding NarL/FixJ family response regulator